MDIKKIIKTCCSFRGISNAQLAKKVDESPTNFNNKLQRNNIMTDDFEKYVGGLDAHIDMKIITNDTSEIMYQYSGKEGKE